MFQIQLIGENTRVESDIDRVETERKKISKFLLIKVGMKRDARFLYIIIVILFENAIPNAPRAAPEVINFESL